MDGYLYVAVGDKGVYGAVGRDGRRLDLHGGGILRLRPDGTALEVYCTGVRNILDVALDAQDELFTYDNTDEHQWMSRLTHMVDGGFYGYPYDFIPRRPYTLWMMADYGSGAATGATCYTEDALPPEYRGDLFLADFGKRQVLRVSVARNGASFRAVARRDIFADMPEDFRPVGLAWSSDGLSLYICDWQHRDTKETVTVGRLLRLTYTGRSHATAKPPWFVPAASGRPFRAPTRELMRGLLHPARSVRDVAQRRLADRGHAAVGPLVAVLGDVKAPAPARWHALWALDAIDGGEARRRVIFAAVADPDASIRRQAIRQLGTRRVREATEILLGRLQDEDLSVRFQAATALGRIGDRAAVAGLISALREVDPFARYAAFTALNRIGRADPATWPALVAALDHRTPAVREGIRLALRETYDERLVAALAGLARDTGRSDKPRAAALDLLAGVVRHRPAWKGEWWAYHPALGTPPARSELWAGTAVVLATLRGTLGDARPAIRLTGVERLREANDRESTERLRRLFRAETNPEVRRAVLSVLGSLHDREAAPLVTEILRAPETDAALLSAAITAAEGIGGQDISAALEHLLVSSPKQGLVQPTIRVLGRLRWAAAAPRLVPYARSDDLAIRQSAVEALVRIGGESGRSAVLGLAEDADPEVRRAAVTALGDLRDRAVVPTLLAAHRDARMRPAALAALLQMSDLRALDAYLEGLGGEDAMLRERSRQAIATIRDQALPALEAQADRLPPRVVVQLRQVYAGHAAAWRGRLFAMAGKAMTAEDYLEFTRTHTGDAARGRRLFFNREGLACIKCHKVGSEGSEVGPDLSTIGSQLDRKQLTESVLYPTRSIRKGYEVITVGMVDGRVLSGLVQSESGGVLVLRDADGKDHALRRADIEERRPSTVSLMPEGLQLGLSPQDLADLIAYLESLRPSSEGAPRH
jgi:putative heme-binding domain-containing protein